MSVQQQIARLQRELDALKAKTPASLPPAQQHAFLCVRPAKVVAQPSGGGSPKTFKIVFIDGEYTRDLAGSGATFIDRQTTAFEFCQNIDNAAAIPPNGTRIDVFWWGDLWWTNWKAATTTTSSEKSFWYIGTPRWTLEATAVEKTSFPDYAITPPTTSWGVRKLTFKPSASTTWSNASPIATYDDTETDYLDGGPIAITEAGRFDIEVAGSFGMRRSTGADPDPDQTKVINAETWVRYYNGTAGADLILGWETIARPGDATFNWVSLTSPTGYEKVDENSNEFSWYFNHKKTLNLSVGAWVTPYVAVSCPADYGLLFNSVTLTMRKMSD